GREDERARPPLPIQRVVSAGRGVGVRHQRQRVYLDHGVPNHHHRAHDVHLRDAAHELGEHHAGHYARCVRARGHWLHERTGGYLLMATATQTQPGLGFPFRTITRLIVDITSTQLASLFTSPLTVVPAQGAGTIILPVVGAVHYKPGSVGFTNNRQVGLFLSSVQITAGNSISFTGTTAQIAPFSNSSTVQTESTIENTDLLLKTLTGD